jgi:hypothetical protein
MQWATEVSIFGQLELDASSRPANVSLIRTTIVCNLHDPYAYHEYHDLHNYRMRSPEPSHTDG